MHMHYYKSMSSMLGDLVAYTLVIVLSMLYPGFALLIGTYDLLRVVWKHSNSGKVYQNTDFIRQLRRLLLIVIILFFHGF